MKLYSLNEYGNYVPFDIDGYTEEIKSQTYINTRREQRSRIREKRKQKEQTLLRRFIGIGILLVSIGLCKIMVTLGERDVSYMIMIVPLALVFIFGND